MESIIKVEYFVEGKIVKKRKLSNKTCLKCDKYPSYGKPGTMKREYCKTHAPIEYVNVKSINCLNCD